MHDIFTRIVRTNTSETGETDYGKRAGTYLNVSRTALYRLIKSHQLSSIKRAGSGECS